MGPFIPKPTNEDEVVEEPTRNRGAYHPPTYPTGRFHDGMWDGRYSYIRCQDCGWETSRYAPDSAFGPDSRAYDEWREHQREAGLIY